jgi:hypothetical protein
MHTQLVALSYALLDTGEDDDMVCSAPHQRL